MIERQIEFRIHNVVEQSEHIRVWGRCLDEPIQLGDVFTRAYHVHLERTADGFGPLMHTKMRPVTLRVTRILLYEREWQVLESGMNGELELVGETSQPLEPPSTRHIKIPRFMGRIRLWRE